MADKHDGLGFITPEEAAAGATAAGLDLTASTAEAAARYKEKHLAEAKAVRDLWDDPVAVRKARCRELLIERRAGKSGYLQDRAIEQVRSNFAADVEAIKIGREGDDRMKELDKELNTHFSPALVAEVNAELDAAEAAAELPDETETRKRIIWQNLRSLKKRARWKNVVIVSKFFEKGIRISYASVKSHTAPKHSRCPEANLLLVYAQIYSEELSDDSIAGDWITTAH